MGNVRFGVTAALLFVPLSSCALLIDTDALEGNGLGDGGTSSDSATAGDGSNPTTGDGSTSDGSTVSPDGIVHLITKNIYGAPNATFKIAFDGGPSVANLSLGFRNSSNVISYSSPVSTSGQVTLPAVAGVYQVELHDTLSGLTSYGQGTVTNAVSGFTSIEQTTLPTFSPFGSVWPQTPMVAGDVTGDGHPDLIIPSGYNAADGSITNPGFYLYPWSTATSQLGSPTTIGMPGRTICSAALLDVDLDGDTDIVFTSDIKASYEFDICTLSNNGSGTFAAPVCISEIGTATKMFDCAGGMAVADFDRDGRADLAIAGGYYDTTDAISTSKDVRILRNTSSGFAPAQTMTASATAQYFSIAIGDLNDDGLLDIVTNGGAPAAVHTFLATGNFAFGDPTQSTGNQTDSYGGFYADQVTLGYLDTDTYLDVLLSHTNGPSSVFYGSTTGLAPFMTIPDFTEQQCARFHVLNLNIDGVPDIIVPYKNRLLANNTLGALWANAGNITTTAAPSAANSIYGSATTSSWVEGDFRFADWDSDGKIDAVNFATYLMTLEVLKGH